MTAIDISYWQHHPDFAQVHASGVGLVIMKCGGGEGGSLYADSVYVANRAAARAQGLAVGSYFFNGPVDPLAAADFQFSVIDWHAGDVVALDVENNGNQQHWNPSQVLAWCQRILSHGVPADRVLVYMSAGLLSLGWDAVAALGVGLWVAQYGPNDGAQHSTPGSGPWSSWSLWQYTSATTCPGIVGNVDTNIISPSWASSSETLLPVIPPTLSIGDTMARYIIRTSDGSQAIVGDLFWHDFSDANRAIISATSICRGQLVDGVAVPDKLNDHDWQINFEEFSARLAGFQRSIGLPSAAGADMPLTDADIARIVKALLDTESARLAN